MFIDYYSYFPMEQDYSTYSNTQSIQTKDFNITCIPHNSNFEIASVIFNDPATIVYWKDGTKTVVKCGEGDTYNKETGLAMAISKKALGNKGNFNDVFHRYLHPEEYKKKDVSATERYEPLAMLNVLLV